jgi:hypothetical protein
MKRSLLLGLTVFVLGASLRAETQVIVERNERGDATAAFRFANVPAPSQTDAAVNARFSIASGRADLNSGDVETLNDGAAPTNEDEPDANFFFDAGTDGGRLLLDLGEAAHVTQVNTYSWHANSRGPQVFRLYAADGSAAVFQARPAVGNDPEQAGWKRLANVDTRPATGKPGGQYGVSVRDSGGGRLGRFRYLLFDIARTDRADRFSNTFFSEIDVCDGNKHAPATPPTAARGFQITIDTSEMPELERWVATKLRPACDEWYPKIADMLASDGFTAPRRVKVAFRKDMRGVAATGGTRIACAGQWFRRNLEGEAVGAVVHELVHVVQQYGRARGGRPNPGWLVEGVADYIRWFLFEPSNLRPRPDPARAKYTDSYRTTAAFLAHVVATHDADAVKKLNAAMREGRYTPELWKTVSGKTVDALWEEYVQTLRKR